MPPNDFIHVRPAQTAHPVNKVVWELYKSSVPLVVCQRLIVNLCATHPEYSVENPEDFVASIYAQQKEHEDNFRKNFPNVNRQP